MRGLSGGGGSAVDVILRVSLVLCSFLAFLSLAIALSSGMSENYLEELSIINVGIPPSARSIVLLSAN